MTTEPDEFVIIIAILGGIFTTFFILIGVITIIVADYLFDKKHEIMYFYNLYIADIVKKVLGFINK
jgi:hypothetical protein